MPEPVEDAGLASDVATLKEMVAVKRQKLGAKYDRFINKVIEVLRANYPAVFQMPDDWLREMVATIDVVGEESRGLMKKLGDYCAGCGWCCSRTTKIVVKKEDAERISRALKQRTDALFAYDGRQWSIKQSHPCQWWNSRNGRCSIYNLRPETCRTWPLAINEHGQKMLHPVAECAYAVLVLANKVMRFMPRAEG